MSEPIKKALDGNEATARVAYAVTEVSAIYPITPSSTMGELADQWAAQGKKNIWGTIPDVIELQSEGGASGALHGALQAGSLATTYTASQGLLLMLPNMYKIAGELTPCVIHVSARSLACQALSIFGDHNDVMSARSTGFAMLCSSSVQEAQDMAMIAHAATLESRIPFVHFFEGFRTSHEINKIELLSEADIREMIDEDLVIAHRKRALSPDHPVIRGTAQNPDVYFQGRESSNVFYDLTIDIIEKTMDKFAKLTRRKYGVVDYYGDPKARSVIVIMGSGAEVVQEAIDTLSKKGEKIGLLHIRLFRPFPKKQFLKLLPASAEAIAVLDRTKEPGSAGEPLYQDVLTILGEALSEKAISKFPHVIGGRYGLSSKEFTPTMVKAIFDELKKTSPKNHFTVGINDDVTHTSLDYDHHFMTESEDTVRAIFFGLGADGTVGANKNSIKIIAENTDNYAQGYFVYDSKKAGSRTVSHLRFGPRPIKSPYLVQSANFIGVHLFNFLEKTNVLGYAAKNATLLLNSPYAADQTWEHLPEPVQKAIINKNIKCYVIDAYKVAKETGMGSRINTIMQTCFFALAKVIPTEIAINKIKEAIRKTYSQKGEEVVNKNNAAVDQALANLHEMKIPAQTSPNAAKLPAVVSSKAPKFVQEVLAKIMCDQGDELPVSAMPVDGTYPVGTTQWEKRNTSAIVATWDPNTCIQCGRCALVCPHGVIRCKRCDQEQLKSAPESFKSAAIKTKGQENKRFALQVYLEDCTGCGLCNAACPVKSKEDAKIKAINLRDKEPVLEAERKNIEFFESIPYENREKLNPSLIPEAQFLEPLFEFSGACAGCGETPYVKLLSQLFGDRMSIANATGCSSIYGGNLPTTPWTKNSEGRGPAWSNSLFEDNAEFGYGFRLSEDKLRQIAKEYLIALGAEIGESLTTELLAHTEDNTEELIHAQRERVKKLRELLAKSNDPKARQLNILADHLVKHSIWILGGDGWAYDIGYGGLDHVLASGRNVNVFVLDTQVYSNTGGQASKATPIGAVAKFAAGGKVTVKKDLGRMAMSYGNVYVAQIALGANPTQAIKAIREAENYDGASLIIAYSHCIAHGINMRCGLDQQKLAVESGYWPLYRYNPDRVKQDLSPFELDSKAPSVALKDYMYNETRFKSLAQQHPEIAAKLLILAEADAKRRFMIYQKMANSTPEK